MATVASPDHAGRAIVVCPLRRKLATPTNTAMHSTAPLNR
jgi:hypothetical protein